uniref:Trophinin associated protein n=1 Tax=Jaculus jaculus TaxID=51337 RepID=A0A8C5P056_JACJA
MTTFQATKDSLLRGVTPTPSKIPVRTQRCPDNPTIKPYPPDQENQDPRRLVQKPPLSTSRSLVDAAGSRRKALHQTEKSQRLMGVTQLRNPLEELKPSPGEQNVQYGPPPQTDAPGAIEFVADPAALATILSGEGVKSCPLGRHSSLAQRVLVRGSKGGTVRRGQNARASAYLAPRTPVHRLDPARSSCFSRLEGPGPRGRTLGLQGMETVIPPLRPSFHPSAHPSLKELRRETCGNSRTKVSQASRLLLETPVQPASLLPEGEHEVASHSDEGGGPLLGLAQRVPLRETQEITQTKTSYSLLRRLANRPKAQFTPIQSAPRVQKAQWLSGLSPQSCPEEPALPWEQIAVRLFDQDSCTRLQEEPGKPPGTSTSQPHSNKTLNLQELKMQRISILQQLLRQEVEGLAVGKCVPFDGGCSLDMVELQPLLTDISRTLSTPQHNSETSHPPGLSKHSGLTEPCLAEECVEPQPCQGLKAEVAQACSATDPGPTEPCCRAEVPGPCPPAQPGHPEACHKVEPLRASVAHSLKPKSPESSSKDCCNQGPLATTSLTFSFQSPLCASPPIHSLQPLRPQTGQSGLSSLAPRTLALRQRLKACLTAIHCSQEARLDDECAFYTSRAPPPGPTRVCTNPVAVLLEWQDSLCFIPVGSMVPQGSPS